MTNSIIERRDVVQAELVESQEALKGLHSNLENVTQELDTLLEESQQYQLLGDICSSLDKLEEIGAAELFWGDGHAGQEQQMERVRSIVNEFQQKVDGIESNKQALQKQIQDHEFKIEDLEDALEEIEEQVERAKYEYLVERDERSLPYREMIMPWTKQGEDERRFRKALLLVFLFVFTLTGLVQVWEVPEINKEEIEVPEHLVKLVKKQKPKPKPPEPKKKEEKKDEKKDDKKKDKKPEKKKEPTPAEKQKARKVAESSGVLAFKDNFSDLMDEDVSEKLGATATISNDGSKAKEDGSRSIVTAQASSGSGGISTASVSRGVAGGAGKKIGGNGVSFSRVESSIGTDAADEPITADGKPSRSDEEIQIVFDRYKNVLYRIYNRELRKDPSLRGRMMLRITIKPDGTVASVKVVSSDMDSAALSSKITARVNRFNFGPKAGVPTITIDYPIDFLPAS